MTSTPTALPDLRQHVDLWVHEGLIDEDCAQRILLTESELAAGSQRGRRARLTEALGYVGGALLALGAVLMTAQLWDEWSIGLRLAVVAACALVLLGAGAVLPANETGLSQRLRSVLWVLGTGAVSLGSGLVAADVLDLDGLDVGLVVTGATSVLALLLWSLSRQPLQLVAVFVALVGLVGTSIAEAAPSGTTGDAARGAGVLVLSAAWLGLALRRRFPPYRLAVLLGGIGAVGGAAVLVVTSWGRFVAVAAVVALLAVGMLLDERLLLAVGTVGLLVVLPPVLMTWFPGALAAPLALIVAGVLVVVLALRVVRRSGG